ALLEERRDGVAYEWSQLLAANPSEHLSASLVVSRLVHAHPVDDFSGVGGIVPLSLELLIAERVLLEQIRQQPPLLAAAADHVATPLLLLDALHEISDLRVDLGYLVHQLPDVFPRLVRHLRRVLL